jgi:hypothetical protein
MMADKTTVAPIDSALKNSPQMDPANEEATVVLDSAAKQCIWNGQAFDDGAVVECGNDNYECSYGRWVKSD